MGDVPVTRADLDATSRRIDDLTTQIEEIRQLLLRSAKNNGQNEQWAINNERVAEPVVHRENNRRRVVEDSELESEEEIEAVDEEEDTEVEDEYAGVEFAMEEGVEILTLVLQRILLSPK
ncbi:Hypothetical predicted protein [Olea europaea subsp. europaea]|uniref:Uncharacterized protein n=1 Tax=Olea europaea subsp. europaea TaxID=158383 RepID=A0A8S0RXP5_OLEEU|nr:Hypothetical predicted protein [Olea europaea subsp. europaea]